MLNVTSATRVLVATTPVDLRGSFNRLYSLVVEQLKGDPLSGHCSCSPTGDGTGSRCFTGMGRWFMGLCEAIGTGTIHLAGK